MAGIYPNSDFIICKGVPLDLGYEHTIYQDSRTAQYNLFHSYQKNGTNSKFHLTAQSYQRLNKGVIRVGIKSDELYDCNYVMFRNTSYTNTDGTAKWFYAFITSVEYINDNCSDITYEIDVMQTWYFDYDLGHCFVEREHTLTDSVDDNYEPEDLAFGDYIVQHRKTLHFKWNESSPLDVKYYVRIYYIPDEKIIHINTDPNTYEISTYTTTKTDPTTGIFYNGMYLAGDYINVPIYGDSLAHQTLTAQNISNIIDAIISNSGNVTTLQFIPNVTFSDTTFTEDDYFSDNVGNTYLPKNHKMYHSPYKKIIVSNSQGKQKEYKWEMFNDSSTQNVKIATFGFNLAKIPKAEAYLYPKNYAQVDIENGIVFDGFPTYAWSEDTFSKWWAQNSTGAIMSMISGAITSFIGVGIAKSSGSVAKYLGSRTALNTVNDSIGFMSQMANAAATPDTQNGTFSGDITSVAQNRMGFTIYELGIRPEIARTIDNFFYKFGYACNKLKELNIRTTSKANLRPHWNYVKTSSCTCHGNNMNSKDEQKIEEIYNKGITYWLNANEVGNYSLVNYPRG